MDVARILQDYLTGRLAEGAVDVVDVSRIHGGGSRETYRFRARYEENGESVERSLILRRTPKNSVVDTESANEFAAYTAFYGTHVPVPRPLFLEEGAKPLGRPFFIMEEAQGESATPFTPDPYGRHRQKVGKQFWEILGTIANSDPEALGLTKVMEVPRVDACWQRELNYWEKVCDEDEGEVNPVVRAGIRRLRKKPPPPAQRIVPVHGDYRNGNFLTDTNGDIQAILDWELAHLGDPLEDVAWAMDPLWTGDDPNVPGGMVSAQDGLKIWKTVSGCEVESRALAWWRCFSAVKAVAIWISAAKEFRKSEEKEPVMALAGWFTLTRHNLILLDFLEKAEF